MTGSAVDAVHPERPGGDPLHLPTSRAVIEWWLADEYGALADAIEGECLLGHDAEGTAACVLAGLRELVNRQEFEDDGASPTAPPVAPQAEVDVDLIQSLAAHIRRVDGSNSLGAAELAEVILPWFAARAAVDVTVLPEWDALVAAINKREASFGVHAALSRYRADADTANAAVRLVRAAGEADRD